MLKAFNGGLGVEFLYIQFYEGGSTMPKKMQEIGEKETISCKKKNLLILRYGQEGGMGESARYVITSNQDGCHGRSKTVAGST